MNVTVVYYLSEAGQRAAALAGIQPSAVQTLELGPDDPAYPQLVALATPTPAGGLLLGIGGAVQIRRGTPGGYGSTRWEDETPSFAGGPIPRGLEAWLRPREPRAPSLDAPLVSGADVLTELAADRLAVEAHAAKQAEEERRRAAAQARRDAEERARQAARLPDLWRSWVALLAEAHDPNLNVPLPPEIEDLRMDDPIYLDDPAFVPDIDSEIGQALLRQGRWYDTIPALTRAVGRAREAAAERAYAGDRARWVAEHGSDHLRSCLELGLDSDRLYRDERLALERPGWVWARALNDFPEHDPRHPTARAVELLRTARAVEPQARLVWTGDGFAAGDVPFLGEPIWLDQHVTRDGTVSALRDWAPPNDADE